MAEAPPDGLYAAAGDAFVEGDRLDVTVARHGPAGVAAVELADGSVWEVDHLDPGRLVALTVDAADPAGSSLLVAAFGGDGAMAVANAAGGIDDQTNDSAWSGVEPDDDFVRSSPRRRPFVAAEAGRLVLLADIAGDLSVDPLPRVTALAELAGSWRRAPAGDLFEPSRDQMLHEADRLAAAVDQTEVEAIDGRDAARIVDVLEPLLARSKLPALANLAARLGGHAEAERRRSERSSQRSALLSPAASYGPSDYDAAPPPVRVEDYRLVERVEPSLLEVTVSRGDDERWVRVIRRDSQVLLALAPLQPRGLLDCADVIVPPDTTDSEIDVQVIAASELVTAPMQPLDLVRRAVQAGHEQRAAERVGAMSLAAGRWHGCAQLWDDAGDAHRARLARERAGPRSWRGPAEPLVVDRLDPYDA